MIIKKLKKKTFFFEIYLQNDQKEPPFGFFRASSDGNSQAALAKSKTTGLQVIASNSGGNSINLRSLVAKDSNRFRFNIIEPFTSSSSIFSFSSFGVESLL